MASKENNTQGTDKEIDLRNSLEKIPSGEAYCDSLWSFCRRATREVKVGATAIGGNNPIRIQSMTTSRGADVDESVRQAMAIAKAGGELVRITAPTTKDAEALGTVVDRLRQAGCNVPIVADIHFSPEAALYAARSVDKVRINPGNYCSARATTNDVEYQAALKEVERKLVPLLTECKQRGVAIRIGINHGSLSPRVKERYGAGPEGMVASALEFVWICRKHGFNNLVLSLKASSPKVMVQANRLLCAKMNALGWDYPLHLGVTEAGDALEGRVKSAIGIGALLADGIGDTIRVSLTEPPAAEIPVGKALVNYIESWPREAIVMWNGSLPYNPYRAVKLEVNSHKLLDERQQGLLVEYATAVDSGSMAQLLIEGGYTRGADGKWENGPTSIDAFLLNDSSQAEFVPLELQSCFATLTQREDGSTWQSMDGSWAMREVTPQMVLSGLATRLADDELVLLRSERPGMHDWRVAIAALRSAGKRNGVVLGYRESVQFIASDYELQTAAAFGAALVDNIGVGIAMPMATGNTMARRREVGLAILQGVEIRRSQAEIVACPGCGRTLFDLQATLQRVKTAMRSQRHLKIGVMGCIVNGPGEMADADYGYVGAGSGHVTLYRGQQPVQKSIKEELALDALKVLIKNDGRWVE